MPIYALFVVSRIFCHQTHHCARIGVRGEGGNHLFEQIVSVFMYSPTDFGEEDGATGKRKVTIETRSPEAELR